MVNKLSWVIFDKPLTFTIFLSMYGFTCINSCTSALLYISVAGRFDEKISSGVTTITQELHGLSLSLLLYV